MTPEKYLTAKELSAALRELGLDYSERWVRASWRAGSRHVGRFGRLSEMIAWVEANPHRHPRARPEIGAEQL